MTASTGLEAKILSMVAQKIMETIPLFQVVAMTQYMDVQVTT